MPVVVCIVAEGDIEAILEGNEVRHRIGRRTVHTNLPVPIERHEPEGRIDVGIDDLNVQTIPFCQWLPVGHTGPAERIDAELQLSRLNHVYIDDLREITKVGAEVIMPVSRARTTSLIVRHTLHALQVSSTERIRA